MKGDAAMGRRIQSFAKWVMIIGIVLCLVSAAVIMIKCYDRNGGFYLLRYATVNGGNPYPSLSSFAEWEVKGNDIFQSICTAVCFVCGAVGILFTFLPVYWLGCLFSSVENLQKKLNAIEETLERMKSHEQ